MRTRGRGTTRGKGGGADGGKDKGTDGNNDTEAIGGNDDVRHPKQQSTNDGGKQMRMTIWGGTSRSKAVKPTEAKVSVVKRPAAQQQQEL